MQDAMSVYLTRISSTTLSPHGSEISLNKVVSCVQRWFMSENKRDCKCDVVMPKS